MDLHRWPSGRDPPPGALHGHGQADGFPVGFRLRGTRCARPPGPQETPLRGALRVNNLSTPWPSAGNRSAIPTVPPDQDWHQQVKQLIETAYGGASLAAPFPALAGKQIQNNGGSGIRRLGGSILMTLDSPEAG